jgi:hypothetical protein
MEWILGRRKRKAMKGIDDGDEGGRDEGEKRSVGKISLKVQGRTRPNGTSNPSQGVCQVKKCAMLAPLPCQEQE